MPINYKKILHLAVACTMTGTLTGCVCNCDPPGQTAQRLSPSDLPASFIDRVPTNDGYASFEMVLIPGDEAGCAVPFYIGRTEVTWDMFRDWANGDDLESLSEYVRLQEIGLRPSMIGRGFPQYDYLLIEDKQGPAIGMSWQTAQAYCIWLSVVTGRTYRLPTDTEWQHVFELSGGVPDDRTLLSRALLADNPRSHDYRGVLLPRPVAQGEPDALGLYDLIGNAAEWVQPMGGRRWVRGGHFGLAAIDFAADWRAEEDQDVWNASYPGFPFSRYWYVTHYYQGIRLVCEVEQDDN